MDTQKQPQQPQQQQENKRNGNKLLHYAMFPFRALGRVRDLYVSSMMGCAGSSTFGSIARASGPLPRSYSYQSTRSSASGEEDFKELIRVTSQRKYGNLNGVNLAAPAGTVPRSQSVAIARIDEDKPVDFSGDLGVPLAVPRSRTVPYHRNRMADVRGR